MRIEDLLTSLRGLAPAVKSAAGMTSFTIASGTAVTAAPNLFSGFWNTADD